MTAPVPVTLHLVPHLGWRGPPCDVSADGLPGAVQYRALPAADFDALQARLRDAEALYDAATDALDAVDNVGKCPFCGAHQPDSWESGEHYDKCQGVALYEALTRLPTPPAPARRWR